jgi:hypothetical protein
MFALNKNNTPNQVKFAQDFSCYLSERMVLTASKPQDKTKIQEVRKQLHENKAQHGPVLGLASSAALWMDCILSD